jgi:hypothetical protein
MSSDTTLRECLAALARDAELLVEWLDGDPATCSMPFDAILARAKQLAAELLELEP